VWLLQAYLEKVVVVQHLSAVQEAATKAEDAWHHAPQRMAPYLAAKMGRSLASERGLGSLLFSLSPRMHP